jgi:hypothetical protein
MCNDKEYRGLSQAYLSHAQDVTLLKGLGVTGGGYVKPRSFWLIECHPVLKFRMACGSKCDSSLIRGSEEFLLAGIPSLAVSVHPGKSRRTFNFLLLTHPHYRILYL